MKPTALLAGALALSASACVSVQVDATDHLQTYSGSSTCDETCLFQLAGRFMDTMVESYLDGAPLADDIRMTENGVDVVPGEGIWETTLGWSVRHTFVDEVQGGIGIFGVVSDQDGSEAIVAFRLQEEGGLITESEGLIVREGEFPLFNPDGIPARHQFSAYVPQHRQNTRSELIEIAEGYFEGLANGDPSALQFHPDCDRRENGFQTTNNPPRINRSCADLYPFVYMHSFREPAFPVVDTELGLVLGVTAFDMPEQELTIDIRGRPFHINPETRRLPRTLFLYELFKVDNGQIIVIDAVLMNQPFGTAMNWGER